METLTVIDGLFGFIDGMDRAGASQNTVRVYLRAAKLFVAYIVFRYGKVDEKGRVVSSHNLIDLKATDFADYPAWLSDNHCFAYHVGKPKGKYYNQEKEETTEIISEQIGKMVLNLKNVHGDAYSIATKDLYVFIASRMLDFWRDRSWITFTKNEAISAKKNSVITSKKVNFGRDIRAKRTPEDLGTRLMKTVKSIDLAEVQGDDRVSKAFRMSVLRKQCLIFLLASSALRAGDIANIERIHIEKARRNNGDLQVEMQKTKRYASSRLLPSIFEMIDAYLEERNDLSPFIFIQHGNWGVPPKHNKLPVRDYRNDKKEGRRGYGKKLSTTSIWRIVREVANDAGYGPGDDAFVSPHGIRHWHAQSLRNLGVPLEQIRTVLGHSSTDVTERVYAPEPNMDIIGESQAKLFDDLA